MRHTFDNSIGKWTRLYGLIILFALFVSACAGEMNPRPYSDSGENFIDGRVPVDRNVYTVKGTIVADVENLTQTQAKGSLAGSGFNGGMYASGSYAMWQEGKGFVRISVDSITPNNDTVNDGDTVIVKTTDQKIMALMPGDKVVFKCRLQYEAIAAIVQNEKFDENKLKTWELDYCRMVTPKIGE